MSPTSSNMGIEIEALELSFNLVSEGFFFGTSNEVHT